jgi:hypothetical protein
LLVAVKPDVNKRSKVNSYTSACKKCEGIVAELREVL